MAGAFNALHEHAVAAGTNSRLIVLLFFLPAYHYYYCYYIYFINIITIITMIIIIIVIIIIIFILKYHWNSIFVLDFLLFIERLNKLEIRSTPSIQCNNKQQNKNSFFSRENNKIKRLIIKKSIICYY